MQSKTISKNHQVMAAFSKSELRTVRRFTNAGITDCKNSLERHNGDPYLAMRDLLTTDEVLKLHRSLTIQNIAPKSMKDPLTRNEIRLVKRLYRDLVLQPGDSSIDYHAPSWRQWLMKLVCGGYGNAPVTPPRSFVGFVADFPVVCDGIHTSGKELADFICCTMMDEGFDISGPSDHGGYAWGMYTSEHRMEIRTIVGFVGAMKANPPRQWLITNECNRGLFRQLFGGYCFAEQRDRFLRRFCECLHRVIAGDERFSNIIWYDKKTFDKPGDQPADSP